jgi:hypothetical protein
MLTLARRRRRTICQSILFLIILAAIGTPTCAATFDRQAFLAAVKDRFESEPALMDLRSPSDPILQVEPFAQKTTGWQANFMRIPGMRLPVTGQSATFGVALAYLASQEIGISLSSGRGDALLVVDDGTLYHRPPSVTLQGIFSNFAGILLRSVFDDRSSCSIQSPVFRGTPAESRFANSICQDLKQVLADAKNEFTDQQLLTSEKEAARTAIQRSQDLLMQASGYGNRQTMEAAIAALESSIAGNDLNDIRSKAQALTNASRDVEQFVAGQHATADSEADARQAANKELARTENLLAQATEYNKRDQVVETKRSLERSLAGEDAEDIRAKTQALRAANDDVAQFIGHHRSTATTQPVVRNPISSVSDDWFLAGILIFVVVLFGFFSIPTLVAFSRRHRSRWAILVVNMAFGATLIGWVIALIWAMNKVDDPVKGGMKIGPAPPDPIL